MPKERTKLLTQITTVYAPADLTVPEAMTLAREWEAMWPEIAALIRKKAMVISHQMEVET